MALLLYRFTCANLSPEEQRVKRVVCEGGYPWKSLSITHGVAREKIVDHVESCLDSLSTHVGTDNDMSGHVILLPGYTPTHVLTLPAKTLW